MKKLFALILSLMLFLPAALAEEMPYAVSAPAPARVTFTFEGNPSTGFLWDCQIKNEGVVALREMHYAADAATENLLGAGGKYTFTLEAVQQGEAIVVFQYARPWEHHVEKQQVYLVTVLEDGVLEVQDMTEQLPLTGTVKEVTEDGVLLETVEQGEVLCRLPEGMTAPMENDLIQVWFNGVMTMSLPGQINVLHWEMVQMQAR